MHHQKSDIHRLYKYVTRERGGRGQLQIEVIHKAQIINIAEYLKTKYVEYQFVNIVKSCEREQQNMN